MMNELEINWNFSKRCRRWFDYIRSAINTKRDKAQWLNKEMNKRSIWYGSMDMISGSCYLLIIHIFIWFGRFSTSNSNFERQKSRKIKELKLANFSANSVCIFLSNIIECVCNVHACVHKCGTVNTLPQISAYFSK